MGIIVKQTGGGDFVPAPAGPTAARCCDVRDLGMIETKFGGEAKIQHKLLVSWLVTAVNAEGQHFMVSKRYTASLHEKAALRADLESWRGRPFTPEELDGFDLDNVIGAPCFFNVVHNTKDGKTYANVTSIMPLPKGMNAPNIPSDFVRYQDRPKDDVPPPNDSHAPVESDDDIPF